MATKRVQCACTIIFNPKGELLLGNKIKYGRWECPGGKADDEESVLATAVRELWEETGLLVPRLTYMGYYDRNPKWLLNVFTGVSTLQPRCMEPDKHSDWTWADHPRNYCLTKVSEDMLLASGFYKEAHWMVLLNREVAYEGLVTRR